MGFKIGGHSIGGSTIGTIAGGGLGGSIGALYDGAKSGVNLTGTGVGGLAGVAAGGGLGTAIGAVYDATHQNKSGGGAPTPAANAPWQASNEYNTGPNKDYFYNQENQYRNMTGQNWTKEQYALAQAQQMSNANRDKNLANVNQWEQSRNPYYASMYQNMQADQNKVSQQAYADSLKRQMLQHAARGTLGGSQSEYNKAQLNAQLAQEQARNAQNAQDYVQGIRQGDQANAQAMRQQFYGQDPYMQKYYESMLAQQGNQSQGYKNMAAMQMQAFQDQQQYQNNLSQIYGGQIGGAGQALTSYVGSR